MTLLRHIAGFLTGLACVGCTTVQPLAPVLPGGVLVPDTKDCHFVVHDSGIVWWTTEYGALAMKPVPQSQEARAQVTIQLHYGICDIATGFGAVWLISGGNQPEVDKIDARTHRQTAHVRLASLWSSKGRRAYLAVGEGAVWATSTAVHKLYRIDPDTAEITAAIPIGSLSVSDGLQRLAAGEGGVWLLHHQTVTRVDPATQRVVAQITIPSLLAGVGEITTGGGAVWVAAGTTLTRIDPRTNTIVATLSTLSPPAALFNQLFIGHMVVANGTLWAMAFQPSGSFFEPTAGRYALVEINMSTNAIVTTRPLGFGATGSLFLGPTLAVADTTAWVCQPTGLYRLPVTPPF